MKLPNDPFAKPDTAQKPLYVVPFWTLKEAKIAALEIAEICNLRFDKRTGTISFPAFDLRFTSKSNTRLKEYRNVIDVAEIDILLLNYRKKVNIMTLTEMYKRLNINNPNNCLVSIIKDTSSATLPLTDYVNRVLNLGFDYDYICGMILSLVERGKVIIYNNTPTE